MFAATTPSRPLFKRRGCGGVGEAETHNAETFTLVGEFAREHGSIRRGREGATLSADTVNDYLGTAAAAINCLTHCRLTVPEFNTRHKRLTKSWLFEDGPKARGARHKRRGFRAQHLRRVVASPFDRTSPEGAFRWEVGLATHSCMMRPGEPGKGKGVRPFDPKRGITLADVIFWSPAQTRTDRHSVVLSIVPSKDQTGRAERRPCPMEALQAGAGPSADPLCGYSAMVRLWRRRAATVCARERYGAIDPATGDRDSIAPCCSDGRTDFPFCEPCRTQPLFRSPAGVEWTSQQGLLLVRDMCAAIGEDPEDFGGQSLRIGGAGDIRDVFGYERGAAIVTARGRWLSDIAEIYQRDIATEQLEASSAMMRSEGVDTEALIRTYAQPTRNFRGGH